MNKKILIGTFFFIACFLSSIFLFQQRKSADFIYNQFMGVYQDQFEQRSKAVASSVYNDLLNYNVISASTRLKQLVGLGQFTGYKIVQGQEIVDEYNYKEGSEVMESIQPIRFSADENWGVIHFITSKTDFSEISKTSVTFVNSFVVFFIIMMVVGLILLVALYASAKYLDRVLLNYFTPNFYPAQGSFYLFWNKLLHNLEVRNRSYLEQVKEVDRIKKIEIFEEVAKQVAHDIRSPLATLNTLLNGDENYKVQNKKLTQLAIERIQSIASDLLTRNVTENKKAAVYLPDMFKQYSDEQNVRYADKLNLSVEMKIDRPLVDLTISTNDLLRLLANLTNNALEAATQAVTQIRLDVVQDDSFITLALSDNGPGMNEEQLAQVGIKGVSFNKEHGHGLGLYHAKKLILENGGDFRIESSLGLGTTIVMRVPYHSLNMVLLDDDSLVRLTWSSQAESKKIKLDIFEDAKEFKGDLKKYDTRTLFYLDYSLGGEENGAQVAQYLVEHGFGRIHLVSGQDDLLTHETKLFHSISGKQFPF